MSHRVSPQIFVQDLKSNVSGMHTSDVLLWLSLGTFIPKTRIAFKIKIQNLKRTIANLLSTSQVDKCLANTDLQQDLFGSFINSNRNLRYFDL